MEKNEAGIRRRHGTSRAVLRGHLPAVSFSGSGTGVWSRTNRNKLPTSGPSGSVSDYQNYAWAPPGESGTEECRGKHSRARHTRGGFKKSPNVSVFHSSKTVTCKQSLGQRVIVAFKGSSRAVKPRAYVSMCRNRYAKKVEKMKR